MHYREGRSGAVQSTRGEFAVKRVCSESAGRGVLIDSGGGWGRVLDAPATHAPAPAIAPHQGGARRHVCTASTVRVTSTAETMKKLAEAAYEERSLPPAKAIVPRAAREPVPNRTRQHQVPGYCRG